jgi:hypothetical protein
MSFLRRLLLSFRRSRPRYGAEVLYAGWVQLPKPFRTTLRRH